MSKSFAKLVAGSEFTHQHIAQNWSAREDSAISFRQKLPAAVEFCKRSSRHQGIHALIALFLGACLTLAFAPFHVFLLGILVPAFLLSLWYLETPKQAFLSGWLFGIGFFGTGVYWVYISIHTFGKAPPALAFLITILFIATLALFPAIQGWLTRRLFKGNHLIWGFPFIWVLFEIIRTYVLTGFPWLLLGYSQMDSILRNMAPVLGVYGVSFITLIFSSLLTALFFIRQRKILFGFPVVVTLIWLSLWGMGFSSFGVHPTGKELTVSLVQGNIHQTLKWKFSELKNILEVYRRLTGQNLSSDLVVWPEAAIPMLQGDAQNFLDEIALLAKRHDMAVILGIPIAYNTNFYNGIIVLGQGEGTYLKRQLVPFGEYIPFRSLLSFILNHIQIPMSDMSPGSTNQGLLKVKGVSLSASICYEIAYPVLIASQLPEAQMLVTLTDDSWFDPSIARDQQLQMTQMRALEVGRYLLAATNDGVTAIINAKGGIVGTIKPTKEGVLTSIVPAMAGSTPWVRLVNWARKLFYQTSYPG